MADAGVAGGAPAGGGRDVAVRAPLALSVSTLRPSGRSLGPGRGGAGRAGGAGPGCTRVDDGGGPGWPVRFGREARPVAPRHLAVIACLWAALQCAARGLHAVLQCAPLKFGRASGRIPVLDGPQGARARAASGAGGLENSGLVPSRGWACAAPAAGVSGADGDGLCASSREIVLRGVQGSVCGDRARVTTRHLARLRIDGQEDTRTWYGL